MPPPVPAVDVVLVTPPLPGAVPPVLPPPVETVDGDCEWLELPHPTATANQAHPIVFHECVIVSSRFGVLDVWTLVAKSKACTKPTVV